LHEQGTVTALAFNDPQRLNDAFQPTAAEEAPDGGGRGWNSED